MPMLLFSSHIYCRHVVMSFIKCWTQALTYLERQLWRAWILDTSVDLHCGAAVKDMDIGHKRWPTLWGSCDGHGAGIVTQALTYLVGQLWRPWCRNCYTSVDLPFGAAVMGMDIGTRVDLHCGAGVTGMNIGQKRWPTLWGRCDGHGYWTKALTYIVGQLWRAWI